jgi:alcohol dehydrogenase class IV
MHTPVDITEEAVALAKTVEADCIVALGGGSTTGLGKAMALWTGLPQIVLPTTYAGSEVSLNSTPMANGIDSNEVGCS